MSRSSLCCSLIVLRSRLISHQRMTRMKGNCTETVRNLFFFPKTRSFSFQFLSSSFFNYRKGKTWGNPGETYSQGSLACAPWCPTRRSPSSVFRAPSCCSCNRRRRCTTGIPVGKRHGNLGDSVCIIYDSLMFYRGRNCGRRRWRGHVRCTSLCLCGEIMRKPQGNTYIFSLPFPQPSLPPPLP